MEITAPLIVVFALVVLLILSFFFRKRQMVYAVGASLVTSVGMWILGSGVMDSRDGTIVPAEEKLLIQIEEQASKIEVLQRELREEKQAVAGFKSKIKGLEEKRPLGKVEANESKKGDPTAREKELYARLIENLKGDKKTERKAEKKEEIFTWESEELNFRLKQSDHDVVRLSDRVLNAEAQGCWRYKKSKGYGILIAEDATGTNLGAEQLDELVISNMKIANEAFEIDKKIEVETPIGKCRVTHIKLNFGGKPLFYIVSNCYNEGYNYQIVTWCMDKASVRKHLIKETEITIENLGLVDPKKKAPAKKLLLAEVYKEESLGVELVNPGVFKFYNLKDDTDTSPAYGANMHGGSFLLHAGELPSHYSSVEILNGYRRLCSLSGKVLLGDVKTREVNGHKVEYVFIPYDVGGGPSKARLELVRHDSRVFVVRTWGRQKDELLDTDVVWESLKVEKEQAGKERKELSEAVKVSSALAANQIGMNAYIEGSIMSAYTAFEYSNSLVPASDSYVGSMIECLVEMGRNKDALEICENHLKNVRKGSKRVLECKARILSFMGRGEESLLSYEKYFADVTFQDDDVFSSYLSLLIEHDQCAEGAKIAKRYYQSFPSTKTQSWLGFLQYKNENYEEAEKTYLEVLANTPKDTFTLDGIINLYLETDDAEKASKYVEHWIKVLPEDIEAKLKKISVLRMKDQGDEVYEYVKNLERQFPNNQLIKVELAKLSSSLGLGDHSLITDHIATVPLSDEITKFIENDEIEREFQEGQDAIQLHHLTSIHINKSGEIRETIRIKGKVLSQIGVENNAKKVIGFYPTAEEVYVNSLIVKDKLGKVTYEGKVKDYFITDKDKEMATHEKNVHIPIKGLEVGSTYELTYTQRTWKTENRFAFKGVWFVSGERVKLKAVSLSGDLSNVRAEVSLPLELVEDTSFSKVWVKKDIKEFVSESLSPDSYKIYPRLVLGYSEMTWPAVSRGYYEHIKERLEPDPAIKALVKKIVKTGSSQEEQVKDVVQWVQANITYQALEFGPRGRMPKASATTVRTREGDCKDMSLLLCHLLNEIGVEAQMALAHTYNQVVEEIADEDQFNHVIVYCPTLANPFIDPTHNHLNLLEYEPYQLSNAFVLPVTESGAELKLVEDAVKVDAGLDIHREISKDEKYVFTKETATLVGYADSYYKGQVKGKTKKELIQYFTYIFSIFYPHIEITEVEVLSDVSDNSVPLKLSIHSRLAREGAGNRVPMLWESNYYFVTRIIDRRNPLSSSFRIHMTSTNSFVTKADFEHEPLELDDKYAHFSSKYEDGKIIIQTERKICEGEVSEFEKMRVQSGKLIPKIKLVMDH